ncbi:hypothetical protein C8R45DRAFT_1080069 [Mycena sanguinolenta]|nr:hypothetical protein C8R45DRAFT_1080069 [Mycena sanguinolenta]
MSPASPFSDLAPEVIFCIFACCDISSVVSAGQTCQYLHNLAFDRSVWQNLLGDLQRRSILHRTGAPLDTLSTDEMIELVRRLMTGPKTWNPQEPECDSFTEVSKTITLHPGSEAVTHAFPPSELSYNAKLLPSGRYVLFANQGTLECWNVAHDRLVWRHTSAINAAMVADFAAEETDIESAILMICVYTHLSNEDRLNYVEIVSLDFRAGIVTPLLAARAPHSGLRKPFYDPLILGALAAVKIGAGRDMYMIINWRAQLYLIVQAPLHETLQIALISQHIMLMTRSQSLAGKQIHLVADETLDAHWAPTVGLNAPAVFSPLLTENIPKLCTFEHTDVQPGHKMYVHKSPIQDGDYRIWIRGTEHMASLTSYRLSLPVNQKPQWQLQTRSMVLVPSSHPVPYSGHIVCRPQTSSEWTIFSPRSSHGSARAKLKFFQAKSLGLAPYSGALIHFTRSIIIVQYYR